MSSLGDSDHGWSEIEQFVAEIAELSQSDLAFTEFCDQLLDRLIEMLSAAGAAIWVRGQQNQLHLQCERNLQLLGSQDPLPTTTEHAQFLQHVIETGQAAIASPGHRITSGKSATNDSEYFWVGTPYRIDSEVTGAIVVLQPAGIGPDALQGNVKLLEMVSDLAGDFLRRQQVHDLRQNDQGWRQYESLVARVHGSLDLRDTAYQLVNDGRSYLGCDRVSLVLRRGTQWRVIAISGVDTFERRSPPIVALEQLVDPVMQLGQRFGFRGDGQSLPPQLESPLSSYLDLSHVQMIEIVPMRNRPVTEMDRDPLGSGSIAALVIEQFDSAGAPVSSERVDRLVALGGKAIGNSLDYDTLPLLSLARFVRRASRAGHRQRSKLYFAGALLLAVALILALVPATLTVEARGELQPEVRRDIYAPLDAEVVEVLHQHGDLVEQGQPLLELRSRPLEIELQRLQGEYQTTEKKLLAVASARVQADEGQTIDRYPGQLAAEEQELKQRLISVQQQLELARRQRDQLNVRSPIAGEVLTWDPQELLADRPVLRGQLLLTTADLTGDWELELQVPDDHAGYMLAAQATGEQPLLVTFSLATDRGTTYEGRIKRVSGRAEILDGQQASVRVTASVPEIERRLLRPGATIYARIDCGKRSLGFVWLHDLIDAVKAWVNY